MFVVAIGELNGSIDAEAGPSASDLGTTAYDARLLLAAGTPAIVKTTPDRALALELLARLRARGHGAVACDASAVVGSADMVAMRRPRLGPDAILLDDRPEERLPYDDILALLPAVHRRRVDTATQTRETKLSMGRAMMTGGMAFTKTVKTETAHCRRGARSGALPVPPQRTDAVDPARARTSWTGHEHDARAVAVARTSGMAVAALRQRAPDATFDDRLSTRKAAERMAMSGAAGNTTVKTSSEAGVDLLAHVLALWIARPPYR